MSQMAHAGRATKDPVAFPAAVGFVGHKASIARVRGMLGQVAQVRAVGQLPSPRQAKDRAPPLLGDEREGGFGGKGGIGFDNHCLHPRRRDESLEHLAKEEILMTWDLGIDHRRAHGHMVASPLRDHQDERLPKDVGGILVGARLARQRCFSPVRSVMVLSPVRCSTPSAGGGSGARVATLNSSTRTAASQYPERSIRSTVQYANEPSMRRVRALSLAPLRSRSA
jgi:hypothetical protein